MNKQPCPICGRKLPRGEQIGHISMEDAPHVHMWKTHCLYCAVTLNRITQHDEEHVPWSSSRVTLANLIRQLGDDEFAGMQDRVKQYPSILNVWREFLKPRRPNDEIWRYAISTTDDPYDHGLTVRRAHHLIGSFCEASVFWEEIDQSIEDCRAMVDYIFNDAL